MGPHLMMSVFVIGDFCGSWMSTDVLTQLEGCSVKSKPLNYCYAGQVRMAWFG